jgi:hypothetical protein
VLGVIHSVDRWLIIGYLGSDLPTFFPCETIERPCQERKELPQKTTRSSYQKWWVNILQAFVSLTHTHADLKSVVFVSVTAFILVLFMYMRAFGECWIHSLFACRRLKCTRVNFFV